MSERRAVELGGVTIAYRDHGDPHAAPVLLLHGMASSGDTWHRLVPELVAAGHRVVVPDLRGHGGSSRTGGYDFAGFTADLAGLLDHLGVAEVSLVGHSLGGHLATLLAQRQPDRVRRLVVEDSPPPPAAPTAPRRRPGTVLVRFAVAVVSGLRSFDRSMVGPVVSQYRTPDPAWWRALPTITAPTLLLSGGRRRHVSGGQLAAAAAVIPDCRLVTINAGHRIHSRAPEAFRAAVLPALT